jgi:hypothetical protein
MSNQKIGRSIDTELQHFSTFVRDTAMVMFEKTNINLSEVLERFYQTPKIKTSATPLGA